MGGDIDFRSNLRDSANTLCAYRGWEGWPDAVEAADEQKVRWIERRRFHRDQNILPPKSLFWGGGKLNDIRRFAVSYELQLPHGIAHVLLLVHRGRRISQTSLVYTCVRTYYR